MKKWGVDTSYLIFDENATTPVIIEKVRKNGNNDAIHSFSFYCPRCNSFLPRYRPVTKKQIDPILEKKPVVDICYIDRVSSGALKIARICKDMGAIIFFEPTKIKDDRQFHEILKISDILKYSNEIQITDLKIVNESTVPLKIETRGSLGLSYYLNNENVKNKKWKSIKAFQVSHVVDSAGAGDWCSAGIIHILKRENIFSIDLLDDVTLKKALMFGQALAGINCQFYGARGSMYSLSKEKFQQSTIYLLNKIDRPINGDISILSNPKKTKGYCPICNNKL
jgi:sugar/nucleoside kinase (ribokinase family)